MEVAIYISESTLSAASFTLCR